MTDSKGNSYRVTLRQIAPTMRYEVIVEGEVVGWGFSSREDAEARAYEAIREDRWGFSRGEQHVDPARVRVSSDQYMVTGIVPAIRETPDGLTSTQSPSWDKEETR
jgi:hypothetical protein